MSAWRPNFKKVTHVIFDMDGVLLDTERLYTEAYQKIVSQYGKNFDWSMKLKLMGLHGKEAAQVVVDTLELPVKWDEFYRMAQEQYTVIMPDCQLMPGAETIVKHLHLNKIPIAVATSSTHDSFELKSKKHKQFFSLFHHIVCGGSDPEVRAGKPNPDIFLVCASRFPGQPNADLCLVVEDAPNGVKAAISAGMQVVMLPDENVPKELQKDAHVVVNSLENAPLEQFGLPPLKT